MAWTIAAYETLVKVEFLFSCYSPYVPDDQIRSLQKKDHFLDHCSVQTI